MVGKDKRIMESIYVNSMQKIIVNEALRREREKKKNKFKRKRKTHFNNPNLKRIIESLTTVDFSDVLFEIPWTCFFSLYLYLILKSKVKYIDWIEDPPYYYSKIAVSQDLNIMKLSREYNVNRNTIRKAYFELVRYKLIESTPEIKPTHKSTKSVCIYNDYFIHSFDKDLGHVVYFNEVPYNFFNK
jgi:hypothetical protein